MSLPQCAAATLCVLLAQTVPAEIALVRHRTIRQSVSQSLLTRSGIAANLGYVWQQWVGLVCVISALAVRRCPLVVISEPTHRLLAEAIS